jgi:DNA-binding transcriptional ArsR family regulator
MIFTFELGVEDLADTRFAISPLAETVFSIWAMTDPGRHTLHLPWLRSARHRLAEVDPGGVLLSLIGTTALPDFVTPRPSSFAPAIEEELAVVSSTAPDVVRREILATFAPESPPEHLRDGVAADGRRVRGLVRRLCELLARYWEATVAPVWAQMRLVLESDTTYRARRLAVGGARALFADMHGNVRWSDGVLEISGLFRERRARVAGRGLLLMPSLFVCKPTPPLLVDEPPWLPYPSRGIATLWAPSLHRDSAALVRLVGRPRARLLALLSEPMPTIEVARRLQVTPSAVSQHLQVLHANGLLARTRDGRRVIYRRTPLADQSWGDEDLA